MLTQRLRQINLFHQMGFRSSWLLFNTIISISMMSHSQGERGKIHRAFTVIGGFMSASERVGSPHLTASDEPPDKTSLHRAPAARL